MPDIQVDQSVRICPMCEDPFEIELGKAGKQKIYCDAECAKEARQTKSRRRNCPTCKNFFELDPSDAAATTYCSEACKLASTHTIREYKNSICLRNGCSNPRAERPGKLHAQFCSSRCATNDHASNYPEGRPCLNCDTIIEFDPKNLRRVQKFCSQDCRNHWMKANVAAYAHRSAEKSRTKSTKQLAKANLYKPKCMPAPGLLKRTPGIAASPEMLWENMPPSQRQFWEEMGWNEDDWNTYDGGFSPAAWRWVNDEQLPGEPPLPKVDKQRNMLK